MLFPASEKGLIFACQTSLLFGSALYCLWVPFACVNLFLLTPLLCFLMGLFELVFYFPLSFLTIDDSLTVFLCKLTNVFWIKCAFDTNNIYMILQTITMKILLCLSWILPIESTVKYSCLHIKIFTLLVCFISATPITHWRFYYCWFIFSQPLLTVFLFLK